jgi:hypothetical protein
MKHGGRPCEGARRASRVAAGGRPDEAHIDPGAIPGPPGRRLHSAEQGILRVWAVMVGPVPWIAGFCQECLTGQRSPFPFTAAVPVTWRSGCRR